MNEVIKIQIVKRICHFTRLSLLVFTIFWMLFALLSGAERIGGGIRGVVYNAPNALPWFILLVFVLLTFKWEFIGGIAIILMGFFTIFFFNALENYFILWMISIPIIIFWNHFFDKLASLQEKIISFKSEALTSKDLLRYNEKEESSHLTYKE